jgi:hypothetical protein
LLGSIRLVANGSFDREEEWGAKGLGLGTFIDKGAIERRQPMRVSDLLRTVPGWWWRSPPAPNRWCA